MSMTDSDHEDVVSESDGSRVSHTTEADDTAQPLYRIYKDSRLPVGKAIGKMMKKRYDAAKKAYEHVYSVWEEAFRYYNNDHMSSMNTTKGLFKRGDNTENVIFSNTNVMLPAIYSK